MASLTSSFSPSSPPSASNSELSASQPTPPTPSHHQGSVKDGATDNGVPDALRQNPLSLDLYADMNSKEYIEKLNKYEADHICRVMAKYFSDKDIYGGKHLFGVSIQGLNLCFTCKTGYNQCQQATYLIKV
ncbi:uncharacterized protein LOC114314149 isoform X3 [Camellia sinensis]|uniref:uncharacterized protein LOC114314149 isoform X3 n=1 Tax=Camellia sinensis TaxID=4442 RepID=UPI0010358E2C|nr:uncharacterized protein LOC114314149 isoform X3 [Camellia sinensis]